MAAAEVARFRAAGGGAIADPTTDGIGRDPTALARIAQATGVHLVMGAGYYVHRSHPDWLETAPEAAIRDRIVADLLDGVAGTGIRSGFIGEVGCSWPMTDRSRTTPARWPCFQPATLPRRTPARSCARPSRRRRCRRGWNGRWPPPGPRSRPGRRSAAGRARTTRICPTSAAPGSTTRSPSIPTRGRCRGASSRCSPVCGTCGRSSNATSTGSTTWRRPWACYSSRRSRTNGPTAWPCRPTRCTTRPERSTSTPRSVRTS